MIRQGDVLLVPIVKMPEDVKEKNKILAYGEVTGHKHQFLSEQVSVFKSKENKQFVTADADVELVHEEHNVVQVPKGIYEVIIQREFDIADNIRQVLD